MCHAACASDRMGACCDDSACTDTPGAVSGPAAACFCSGSVLPHSDPPAAWLVFAQLGWADPSHRVDAVAQRVLPAVGYAAWSTGPPPDQLVVPLLI
jgi:hypothetical protein